MEQASAATLTPDKGVKGFTVSTNDVAPFDRREWLEDVVRREYTRVVITPPKNGQLFNEMTFFDWDRLRLSLVRSNQITLNRLAYEPSHISQDNYFGVVSLGGDYRLEQDGREAVLQPGDLTIYDATRPHRIQCNNNYAKLIVSIPRAMMRDRLAGVEHCTALRIPGVTGIGAVAGGFIRNAAQQAQHMDTSSFNTLADNAVDLFTLALASVRPQDFMLSRSRSLSLQRVKDFVERNLANPELDTAAIAAGTGFSPRYINDLFRDADASLMRYVWQRRLENCHKDMLSPLHTGRKVSEIALRWGFNDLSHFSRAFRQRFGCAPRELCDSPASSRT